MKKNTLKKLTFWSLPLFILHGLEEYFAEYVGIGSIISTPSETFLLFEIMFWTALGIFVISLTKWKYILFYVLGLIFVYEFIHLIWSLHSLSYQPGLISGAVLVVFGAFYWRELINAKTSEI